jgi:hydroxymethylpyrimidine/phosphomethylpyrimidine kinase
MAADSTRGRGGGVPIALTIAGSDSGGGAGIQADLKTFSALGVYGASAVTAVTAQNTRAVSAVHPIPPEVVTAQIAAVLDDLAVGAVKIGMLGSPEIVAAVASALNGCGLPLVLDPVMIAKSGDALLSAPAVSALRRDLLPLADVLTPNLPEAARLLETSEAACEADMERQGRRLLALGPQAVVMKGGHGHGPRCVDLLLCRDAAPLRLEARRCDTGNTHGTGCTLSAAIAAGLAKGQDIAEALRGAHTYLQAAIAAADRLGVGSGHGPVHHFHGVWG